MALDAVLLKDARDLLAVSDFGIGDRLTNATDLAANNVRCRHAHLFAGGELADRLGQVALRGRGALVADAIGEAILIVDASAIAHHAILVEHEHLGRTLGAELIGNLVAGVLQQRKLDVMPLCVGGDFFDRILPVRVDRQEGDLRAFELLGQVSQPRTVELGQRALGPTNATTTTSASFTSASEYSLPNWFLSAKSFDLRAEAIRLGGVYRRTDGERRDSQERGKLGAEHVKPLMDGSERTLS